MKLENQVCTLEQAKRLKELGVTQESYFHFGDHLDGVTESWMHEGDEDVFYAAFTVAELGVMIGRGTNAATLFYDAVQDRMNRSHSFTIALDVQFVANCIIGMLETGRLTMEEVNQRLKAA